MTTIAIRWQRKTEAGFAVTVSFDGRTEYPVEIQDPFDARQERRLAWYFERWIHQPTTETVKAAAVRRGLREYGDRLFAQVFLADRDAEYEYRQVRGNLSRVQIEIVGNDPAFQALHWEAMRDPKLDKLLALECVMLRRQDWRAVVPAELAPSQRINVLLVTARPDEEKDLQYRVTSRPLLAAIENSQMPINLVLLRPGTYEALKEHLNATPEGFYHIVHFDAHGGVMNYELMQAHKKQDRMLLKSRSGGREDIQPFGGERAFFFFETETKGVADPVETQELATLLNGKRIPVCILDACQLAQNPAGEAEEAETGLGDSLGSRLMTAGMQMVVAMRYSILAEAAGQLMGQFYQALVSKRSLLEAVRLGRRELFNRKSRRANYNQQIDLEDWLLPVVYCNQPQAMTIELQPRLPEEEAAYWQQQASQYRFPEPTYGFVGRDLEILKIEKSLLRRNVLLVQGMGGTGKTTLLNFLRQWWQKTNFVARSFYFGYDQKAWTLAQILHEIGKAIYSTYEQATFQAMPPEAQQQKLVATLRSGCTQTQLPYALILDNLESVTGQDLAIQNTLPPAEQQQICDFLSRLVGGKIYVVLGSRSSEDWLKRATFRDNVYVLQGLDPESRSQLAEKILQQQVGDRAAAIRQDPQFAQLMKLLAGYPLAMEVVLTNLRRQSPSEILAALDAADVALDSGSAEKTESILKCVEYSHSNLSEVAQTLLLSLAPFNGFVWLRGLPNYLTLPALKRQGFFRKQL